MGNWFTNIHVACEDPKWVRGALRAAWCLPAWITGGRGGWTSIYPHATESLDDALLRQLGRELSLRLRAPALTMLVADDSVYSHCLAEEGRVVDGYLSNPEFIDDSSWLPLPPSNRARLLALCPPGTTDAALRQALGGPDTVFASEIASALGELLGIGAARACSGWKYLDAGDAPLSDEDDPVERLQGDGLGFVGQPPWRPARAKNKDGSTSTT